MRPRNETARLRLPVVLGGKRGASAADLARELGISVPTVHRVLGDLPAEKLLSAGRSRRTRYALRRPLRGDFSDLPLYAIDRDGEASLIGNLALTQPLGTLLQLAGSGWPFPADSRDGWWDGLPYPLHDMRPQGYLGRQFARAEHEQLGVSANPEEWTDDDVVFVLSRAGTDTIGNLLLGDPAYRRWLHAKVAAAEPFAEAALGEHYALRAQDALRVGLAGSSAAGEFPKFTALRAAAFDTPHVLVKFSGSGASAAERRWGDLLVCEHLALESAATLPGITSARTRIVVYAGRVFLEGERFDRVGAHGRLPVCTLDALNASFLGSSTMDWTRLVGQLHALGVVDGDTARAVEHLWWFGRLVANTDMHLGNLSFQVAPVLRLAPVYDMLPMAYAPLPGGEVPPREYEPPLPLPPQRSTWQAAAAAAIAFWQRAANDTRISSAFRGSCAANARALAEAVP